MLLRVYFQLVSRSFVRPRRPAMSLSESQQDALEQLCAVTASDTASARQRDERILRENGWDVQVGSSLKRWSHDSLGLADSQRAVEQIFSGATSATPAPRPTPSGPSRSSSVHESDPMLNPPPPGSRRLSGSVGRRPSGAGTSGVGIWGFISLPIRLVFSIITSTWYFIGKLIWSRLCGVKSSADFHPFILLTPPPEVPSSAQRPNLQTATTKHHGHIVILRARLGDVHRLFGRDELAPRILHRPVPRVHAQRAQRGQGRHGRGRLWRA